MLAKHCLQEFKLDCQLRRLSDRTIKGYYNNPLNFLMLEMRFAVLPTPLVTITHRLTCVMDWMSIPYLNLKDVEVRAKKYATGDLHWLHTALSNLKNLPRGTYHGRCTALQPYLDEFCFRFNRRMCAGQLFSRLTRAVATSGNVLSEVDKHYT